MAVLNKYNKIHNSSRSSYSYKHMSVNICKPYSVICQSDISFKGIFPKGIVIAMDIFGLGFQKYIQFKQRDNIKYGEDGEQNWSLEASFVEVFTTLRDLSQIIRDWMLDAKCFNVIVQAASFLMATFSLASTPSSDELEPIKPLKHKGWKRREEMKVSGEGY